MAAVVTPGQTAAVPVSATLAGTGWRRGNFFAVIALPGVIAIVALFIVPLFMVLLRSVTDPGPENFAAALSSPVFQKSLWTTVQMALVVTALCVVFSYPYAIVMARSGPVMLMVLLACLMFAFWTSSLVRTYAWKILLNNTGIINTALVDWGVIPEPLPLIGGNFAIYIGMMQILMPYTILTLYAQMRGIPDDLEMAAQTMGARPLSAFFRVTFPLSLPGAAAGGLLVFVIALGFYITPQLLGNPREVYVGSSIVQNFDALLQPGVGAAQSVVLLLLALIILLGIGRFVGIGKILGVGGRTR
ncbi:ABC transporter permease [Microbacterium lushaniae]|uniref:ABC transporter permease n=1 Tax=Microbacterium lushaniae TaxID=2614639 RepID=A0A5J6KZK8_9MICO|nr:ABC transporter permease [Microbacterium lushaniae]QEW01644.1 ABC transporter permease [Microbacterium lushaniae]